MTGPGTLGLFGPEPEAGPARLGPNYTQQARTRLAHGLHPLMAAPVLGNSGARCGNCTHLTVSVHARGYLKCDRFSTRSEATDIRRWWPGCQLWKAAAAGGNTAPAAKDNDHATVKATR